MPLLLSAHGVPIVLGRTAPGILLRRALVFGSMCSGCCVEFHTRPRLLWHLMYSVSSCLAAYASFFTPCDDATVDAAGFSDRVESRALRRAGEYDRVARLRAVRVHGCTLHATFGTWS